MTNEKTMAVSSMKKSLRTYSTVPTQLLSLFNIMYLFNDYLEKDLRKFILMRCFQLCE